MSDKKPTSGLLLGGERSDDNCYTLIESTESNLCQVSKIENVEIWHKKLGHIDYKLLQTLSLT